MEYTFNYYLGFDFGGMNNTEDCRGTFKVNLSDKDVQGIRLLLKESDSDVPAFINIKEHLPKIHELIMKELNKVASDYMTVQIFKEGASDVFIFDVMEEDVKSGAFDPKSDPEYDGSEDSMFEIWENWQDEKLEKMSLHEKAVYLRDRYQIIPEKEELCALEIEYMLPDSLTEEIKK